MCKNVEYAKELRIGEKNRDASDNIRGFLYQDHLAIELLLSAKDDDKIYVEWIEDIFIENDDTISIYQVKYYPRTKLCFNEICKNMFYQLLKYKLFETDEIKEKKEVRTYCLYYAEEFTDVNEDEIKKICINNENDINKINKEGIIDELKNCSNMPMREKLIFEKVASSSLFEKLNFEKIKKNNIESIRRVLKEKLFNAIEIDKNLFYMKNDEDIKNILLSVALQYIQKSYFNKSEDYNERYMTKVKFFEYLNKTVGIEDEKYVERIKYIVLGYVDEIFYDIYCEIVEDENLKIYKEIYISTKKYFINILENKEQRFKFLNTISTDQYDNLNRDIYLNYSLADEVDKFLEHKEKIRHFVLSIWKIIYNIGCTNFGKFLNDKKYDCILFEHPEEKGKPVIVVSSSGIEVSRDAKKVYNRILNMKTKPRKWYCKGNLKGLYEYSYKVSKINEAKMNDKYNFLVKEQDCFIIECMNCISCDVDEIEVKDPDFNCIFELNCKEIRNGNL